jgi:hypothetical protein
LREKFFAGFRDSEIQGFEDIIPPYSLSRNPSRSVSPLRFAGTFFKEAFFLRFGRLKLFLSGKQDSYPSLYPERAAKITGYEWRLEAIIFRK